MRVALLSLLLSMCCAAYAVAQSSVLQSLDTGDDARGWEAVGRLDIDGKGFCTGALIAPDLVLTAAHCMFEAANGPAIDATRIQFRAGLRGGRAEATRGVRVAVIHPQYRHTGEAEQEQVRHDVALLELDRPIRATQIDPFPVSATVRRGSQVGVVSYAEDRAEAPSLQETCNVMGKQDGILVMDCDVNYGSSGAPIFITRNGTVQLVSVVSAMADINGDRVALGMDLAAPIAALRLALERERFVFSTPPATARIIRPGERADTGARFVRP